METNHIVVLHVEDNRDTALLVQMAFTSFGFRGQFISLRTVHDALALLAEKERDRQQIHLILLDIRLPDGSGIDVIRALKCSDWWRWTPVIMLSNESSSDVVNSAYAVGANCFLAKLPADSSLVQSLDGLYRCWIQGAHWPSPPTADRLQTIIARGIDARTRAAHFCLSVARALNNAAELRFWLDRAMIEGNIANLLAFVRPLVHERDVPSELINRLTAMQQHLPRTFQIAEVKLQSSIVPDTIEVCAAAFGILTPPSDAEAVVEVLNSIFSLSPEAISSLKRLAAAQANELAGYTLERTHEPHLRSRARELQEYADQLLQGT